MTCRRGKDASERRGIGNEIAGQLEMAQLAAQ